MITAIKKAKQKYKNLSNEDFIEFSCPDIIIKTIKKPKWCMEKKKGCRTIEPNHTCEECWNREVEG